MTQSRVATTASAPVVMFTAEEILTGLANYEVHEVDALTGEEAERLAFAIIKSEPALKGARVHSPPAILRKGSFMQKHARRAGRTGTRSARLSVTPGGRLRG